jgi:AraC-like DNA-binding protein
MVEGAALRVLPTGIAFASRLAIAALQARNLPAAALLKRAGLSEREIEAPRGRVSLVSQGKFLEYAAEALEDSALGLHLAERANPREAGLLFYVTSAGRNLEEALALFARYTRIVNDSVRLKLAPIADGVELQVTYVGVSSHHARQFTEFGTAIAIKVFREIVGRRIRPTRVTCVHGRNADLREFERYYGCEVAFGSPSDLIAFSDETLSTLLITRDPYLLETLRPFCDEATKSRGTAQGTLRAAVENEIQRLLPHGQAQAATVARSLAMSVRTLSRRLAGEKTSLPEIVDELRRSLAAEYLKEPGFTLREIAYLLGYEGTTSFNRAFRRWTGHSPSQARNQKLLSAPA